MPNRPAPPPPTAHGLCDAQWEEAEYRDALAEDWRAVIADEPKCENPQMKARDWLRFAGIYSLEDWLLSWRIEHESQRDDSEVG
jgi:hypothetical protein